MRIKLKINNDKLISIAIMSSFFILTFQYLILTYFKLFDTSMGTNIKLISKSIVGLFYFIALPFVFKRRKIFFLSSYFISAFIFLLTYYMFPENIPFIYKNLFFHFFVVLPSFIYAFSLKDFGELKQIMDKVGTSVFIISLFIGILVFFGNFSVGKYSMALSYYLLLPLLIYTDKLFNKISIIYASVIFISIIIIISLGSRGPLFSFLFFLLYRLVLTNDKITIKRISIYLSIIFSGMILFLFYMDILRFINNILLKFNIKSRTLELFMQDIFYLSGRGNLYSKLLKSISKKPFLGVGLFGDRRVIGKYAHNIFFELWHCFWYNCNFIFILYYLLSFNKNKARRNNKFYVSLVLHRFCTFII